ncbi:hypothetical protein BDW62DRAFT_47157 [Aspergillus aurantiobrunneus]
MPMLYTQNTMSLMMLVDIQLYFDYNGLAADNADPITFYCNFEQTRFDEVLQYVEFPPLRLRKTEIPRGETFQRHKEFLQAKTGGLLGTVLKSCKVGAALDNRHTQNEAEQAKIVICPWCNSSLAIRPRVNVCTPAATACERTPGLKTGYELIHQRQDEERIAEGLISRAAYEPFVCWE